ncbi:MAG: MFS transporter [Candidatus Aramenus sp.]|jgi:SHS family lactate transporter-like MFS transporter|nr:MFS transporter [Candidatus Aramenus sp.]
MRRYVHATIASTLAWAGNIYDLLLITYVYPYLSSAYSLNFFALSALFALGLIGRVIGGLAFGRYADAIGRKPVLIIGTGGYAVFQGIMAFSPNVFLLFAFRLLEGVFMGGEWTAGTVIAYEQAPTSMKGVVTGIVQAGYGIGYALTGATYLLFLPVIHTEWRYFLLVGALPLLLVPYIQFKVCESRSSTSSASVKYKDYYPVLVKATLGISGMFVAYFSLFGNYPVVEEYYSHVSPSEVGDILTVANLLLAVSFVLFGRLADYVNKKKLIYAGLIGLLVSLPFAVPGLAPVNNVAIYLGTVVFAFSTGFWPLMPLLVAETVPLEVRGTLSGFAYNFGSFVGGMANIVLGFIGSAFGMGALAKAIDGAGMLAIAVVLVSVITWPKSGSTANVVSNG